MNVALRLSNRWQVNAIRDHSEKFSIRYATYVQESSRIDKWIVFLNGRTEWIEKYRHLPEELRLPNYCGFLTVDHRGQGASGGERSYVDHYDSYGLDVKKVVEHIVKDQPYVIISHSTGALIALYATLKELIFPQAIVMSSPLLRLANQPVPRAIANPISKVISGLGLGNLKTGAGAYARAHFEHNKLTHWAEGFQEIKKSPYDSPTASFKWVAATFDAIKYVFDPEHIKKLDIPVLILAASQEQVVDPRGATDWIQVANNFVSHLVRYEMIPGAKHELFFEIPKFRQQAIERARSFLQKFLDNND